MNYIGSDELSTQIKQSEEVDDLSFNKTDSTITTKKSKQLVSLEGNSTESIGDELLNELKSEKNTTTTKAPNKASPTSIASIILIVISFLCTFV